MVEDWEEHMLAADEISADMIPVVVMRVDNAAVEKMSAAVVASSDCSTSHHHQEGILTCHWPASHMQAMAEAYLLSLSLLV